LIFVDPPYRLAGELGPQLAAVIGSVLAPAGRVVAESDRQRPLELGMTLLRERHYGDTLIRIYAYE
jgi:16S rRNA (guanine966-N2)-methyltransferase